MPQNVGYSVISGAIGGILLYWLKSIQASGIWELLVLIPMGAIVANAAVLPVAIPGRHWSFSFICSLAMLMALIAGAILSSKFNFEHSRDPFYKIGFIKPEMISLEVSKVNQLTFGTIIIGGCLGIFYGLLSGRLASMVVGLSMGSATGFILGLLSVHVVGRNSPFVTYFGQHNVDNWVYDSPLHFAWQGALLLGLLHLGACFGAALGAGAKK